MASILTCKMYRSCDHKEKILAAIANPVNLKLVQQLREQLNDDFLTREYFPERKQEKEQEKEHEKGAEFTRDTEVAESPEINVNVDVPESKTTTEPEEEPPVDLDFSQSLEGSAVMSSESVETSDVTEANEVDLDSLLGLINSREETQGAARCLKKNNELWIYFNDSINLNTIMDKVIMLLNSASYTTLEFNRIARSENAMVFEVVEVVSAQHEE